MVEAPGLTIGLLHLAGDQGIQPGTSGSMSIGFEVEELESAIETLANDGQLFMEKNPGKENGVEIVRELRDHGDFAEFNFIDVDGNLMMVCWSPEK